VPRVDASADPHQCDTFETIETSPTIKEIEKRLPKLGCTKEQVSRHLDQVTKSRAQPTERKRSKYRPYRSIGHSDRAGLRAIHQASRNGLIALPIGENHEVSCSHRCCDKGAGFPITLAVTSASSNRFHLEKASRRGGTPLVFCAMRCKGMRLISEVSYPHLVARRFSATSKV
jgi:hypothetical protein